MTPYTPDQIFVEHSVSESTITQNVLRRLPEIPVKHIASTENLLKESQQWNPTIPVAKRSLILTRQKGNFFKACPAGQIKTGTSNVCCNYFVVNYASNCHMECSYCYLQSYLNFPHMVVYANSDDLLSELELILNQQPEKHLRIGTGELADSLALDHLTSYSIPLVEFFAQQEKGILEFKTKSNCVENILSLDHQSKTVVSWSISPQTIQQKEEHKTATLNERLTAAEQCVKAGYPIAFHLDPLIFYPNWETDYSALIQEIFDRIPAKSIPWISIGSLRVTPQLKEIMRQRFGKSFLPLGELVPCEDGKLRYFKPIRVLMFQKVFNWILARAPRTTVYTCMETHDVWTKVFQELPPNEQKLGQRITQPLVLLG